MHSRRFVIATPLLLLGSAVSAQSADPAEPVRRLYASYGIGDHADPAKLDRQDPAALYSASLFALYRRATKAGLDFDFFVQGQDFSLAGPIAIGEVAIRGDRATVAAALTSNDIDPKTHRKRVDDFVFAMVRQGGRWRIDDARHGRQSLRQAWDEMIRNPA